MKRLPILLAAFVTLAISVPAFAAETSTYAFSAQNDSGEKGKATIKPAGSGMEVTVNLEGAPADAEQPIHIHKGTCAKFDPKPMYMLTSVTKGVSKTKLDVPMSTLAEGDYVINVHKSVKEIATYVSCADLKPAK